MTEFPLKEFASIKTPFYYYDKKLLVATLDAIKKASPEAEYHVHYAIKANANPEILKYICEAGFGVDCVRHSICRSG